MKIRVQLLLGVAAALAVVAAAVLFTWSATRQASAWDEELKRAQTVAQEVSGLLILTQEFASHFERRAEQQWHHRYDMLTGALATSSDSSSVSHASLERMRVHMRRLPDLLNKLSELADEEDSAFVQRRKQFLLDQLLTDTQVLADGANRWTDDAVVGQHRAWRQLQMTLAAVLVTLLGLVVAQGVWLSRRVLKPLAALERATVAIEQGRLDVTVEGGTADELGSLARSFNAMTAALAERTEQYEHEAALRRASERRIRTITDNMPALIAYVDRHGRYQFTNAYYRTVYGVEPDTFIGKTLEEALGPQAAADVAPHARAALAGERVRFERHANGDGPDAHFLVDFQPDVNADGEVAGFYAMVLDITARKQAELRQADSEERIRAILTHAPDAFIGMDEQGRITEWNRQAELTFGWHRDEVIGRTVADVVIPPESRHAHSAGLARFVHTGQGPVVNNRIEVQALHRDGHLIPVELSVASVRQGDHFVATAFLHDISDRKAAQAQLAASEQRLKDVTNSIPALIGYFDREQRCRFANEPALRIYDPDRLGVAGVTLRDLLGPDNHEQHLPHVLQALSGRRSVLDGQVPFKGGVASFQAHVIPVRDGSGGVDGFYIMTFDVTALKQAEMARAAGEQRLRTITDNLPVLISYIDRDHRLRFCNGTFETWLGIKPATAEGQRVKDVIGEALYEERRAQIEQAMAGDRLSFEIESEARGVQRHLQTAYIPDRAADGSIAGIYTMSTDVTKLKKVERQLSILARFDSLTGLPNRRHFEEKLQEALDRAERSRQVTAVLFLDVDKFKSINDTLGHGAGDEVLKEFALRLLRCVRKTDTVARLAGDEFVIILEGLHSGDEPQFVARKIIAAMAMPFEVNGFELDVSTSIGVATAEGGGCGPVRLLALADEALYEAKSAGRNTFRAAPRAANPS